MNLNNTTKNKSMLDGVVIVAVTIIGAGMFSLPIVSAGMWFSWSVIFLVVVWFFMYHSGLMILEVNLNYPVGSSFDTFVKDVLGSHWNLINNIAICFVLYLLLYAYISGGGSVISHTLRESDKSSIDSRTASMLFTFVLASIIFLSAKLVSRVAATLILGMSIAFSMLIFDLNEHIKLSNLIDVGTKQTDYFIYALSALPFYLTSFGFHGNVPSLVKIYGKKAKTINRCILYGTLIALFVYLVWLFSSLGVISRSSFTDILNQGGNIGQLVSALERISQSNTLSFLLNSFANIAIITSFLGVGLGLFDFISDKFRFTNDKTGRFKTALICFLPPLLGVTIHPNGFLYAIGFAAIGAAIWGAIIPALAVKASRKKHLNPRYTLWGGNSLIYAVIIYGIVTILAHLLAMLNLLPQSFTG
ncbi:MAG: aromatic amino acid transporter [Kangiellaceae bacterium]